MAQSRDDFKKELDKVYAAKNIGGDLKKLAVDLLAEYLYLHQYSDMAILSEGSFLKSKLLTSRIHHAADNFYSVHRGNNEILEITNIMCKETLKVKKYDIITTLGDFKLVYMRDETLTTEKKFDFKAILTNGVKSLTIDGTGKLYLDLPVDHANISQNIAVYEVGSDPSILNEIEIVDNIYQITPDLIEKEPANKIMAMTMPHFSVRLWSACKFDLNKEYLIKYLTCPDPKLTLISSITQPILDVYM